MAILRTEYVKEIASHVSNGVVVFVHKNSREIRPMPKPEGDLEEWKTQCAELEADDKYWLRIKKVPMDDELHLRKEFVAEVTDAHFKKQLTNALNRKNPLRNFHQAVEGDEILNQHWRNYKRGAYQDWVSNFIIDEYNY